MFEYAFYRAQTTFPSLFTTSVNAVLLFPKGPQDVCLWTAETFMKYVDPRMPGAPVSLARDVKPPFCSSTLQLFSG